MTGSALSPIFRSKIRDALARAGLGGVVDPRVWKKDWTVNGQPIGRRERAALYLSRSVSHVALTNHHLERVEQDRVTCRYTDARTHATKRRTLPVDTFIGHFLQHMLPRGFTKIRSYGLLSPSNRVELEHARSGLECHAAAAHAHAHPHEGEREGKQTDAHSASVSVDGASVAVASVAIPATRRLGTVRRADAASSISSSVFDDRGHHHGKPSSIAARPSGSQRLRRQRRRLVLLFVITRTYYSVADRARWM